MVATNLTGPILAEQAALQWMLPAKRGHIINVASVAGHIGTTGVYSATKFGLRGHTEALRREVVVPGWYRIVISFNRWFPGLTDWVTSRFLRAEGGVGQARRLRLR